MAKGVVWVPNEVDRLLEKIAEIQAHCDHEFIAVEKPTLRESKVRGVYIAFDASITLGLYYTTVILRCRHCSLQKESSASQVCLNCGVEMKDLGGLSDRATYFGTKHSYYDAQLKQCEKCGLKVVVDVWNH